MNLLSYVHLRNIYRSTGVGRVSRELTQHFAKAQGVTLHVLADPRDHERIVPLVGPPWNTFPYHFFKSETSKQQLRWILTDSPPAEVYWPEVDLVHCTAESFVPVRKAKLVVTCHDAQHFEPSAHRTSLWLLKQRLKWRLLFFRLEKEADMLQMISCFAAERTAHFFPGLRDRLRVVPNAASDSFFEGPTEQGLTVLDRLGVRDRPYILVPGGLQFRKNAELILSAWPKIAEKQPELRLVIINHADPAYLPRAQAMGASCVLGGFQEEPELVALYHSAILVWFPTLYDGFGMPVMEAMASGTPVVSSNTSAIPEIAGDAAVLLSPHDVDAHVSAITGLLEDAPAREQFRAKGRARAANYTWQGSAQKLMAEFRALL